MQLETTEEMEQPAASAENSEEKPAETSPSDTNQVTKNKTKDQGETLQNDKDVMLQVIKTIQSCMLTCQSFGNSTNAAYPCQRHRFIRAIKVIAWTNH